MATVQGYGVRRRRFRTVLAAPASLLLVAGSLTGCSLLNSETDPKAIVIPSTDALSTEVPSSTPRSSTSRTADSTELPPGDSYEYVIDNAPRLSNSGFRTGSSTPTGDREDNLAGFHFATPDRSIRCSVGTTDDDVLACVGDKVRGRPGPPPGSPDGCDWKTSYVILSSDDVQAGACSNLYPVMYRSMMVPFGSAVHIDRFSCLSDFSGLYCLESSSGNGFSITSAGYQEIHGDDRAPKSMRPDSGTTTSSAKRPSTVVPSR
ncbi:MAG: hypothetical protein QM658_12645 [Gordonia sp. (in: high G+C Gram-positive bacteria)]